ncbi:MAG: hypothetical protein ACOYK8_00095 [Alphaproteobacteria bacterium]
MADQLHRVLITDQPSVGWDFRNLSFLKPYLQYLDDQKQPFEIRFYVDGRLCFPIGDMIDMEQYDYLYGFHSNHYKRGEKSKELLEYYKTLSDTVFSLDEMPRQLHALQPELFPLLTDIDPDISQMGAYLTPNTERLEHYKEVLQEKRQALLAIANENEPDKFRDVAFVVVAGLSPITDAVADRAEKIRLGQAKSIHFELLAEILHDYQVKAATKGILVLPISAQFSSPPYNNLQELAVGLRDVSNNYGVWPAIDTLGVDWDNNFMDQIALMAALQHDAEGHGLPSVAFGNAATYQNIIFGVGGYDCQMMGHHAEAINGRDDRLFFNALQDKMLGRLTMHYQDVQALGDWTPVVEGMKQQLRQLVGEKIPSSDLINSQDYGNNVRHSGVNPKPKI